MTNCSRKVLDRLRAVDWADVDLAYGHENSRTRLMREYLRRAALWARHCDADEAWPFFDIAEHVDPAVQIPDDVAAELDEFLQGGIGPFSVEATCRAAGRWAALRAEDKVGAPSLPDPYEPLLALYERGGGFFVEEFIDLTGVMIRLGNVASNASATPFLTLAPATLDALDAEGDITYYAKISDDYPRETPRGIIRRGVDDGQTYDEAFTRNLRWEPTEYLRLYDLGHNDIDHAEITEIEAATFIESITTKLTQAR